MSDEMFHKRGPREGTGYSVKNRKGLVAAVIFLLITVGVVIAAVNAPIYLHTPPLATLLVGMGIVIVLIFGFVGFVMTHSDVSHKK
jgi:polyferredoxin